MILPVVTATITLDLRVNPIPSPATPEAIEVCDEDNDGFTFFDIETYADGDYQWRT